MKNVYHIGRFRFDSYTEYKKGVEDVKKIKQISDELDINEPGVAMRLYTLIRQNDIKFQSVIGEDYLLYLSDLVADDYKGLADGTEAYLAEPGRVSSPRRIAGILCIVVAVICFAYFWGSEYISYQKTREIKELQENKNVSRAAEYIAGALNETISNKNNNDIVENQVENEEYAAEPQTQEEEKEAPLKILADYTGLYEENQDLAGWITIPDTEINFPVLQSKESTDYYLNRNFYKEDDDNGSIFLDSRNDFVNRDTNLIVYGHNMKSGLMFGSLKKYENEDYWKKHKNIQFHTLYEKGEYDIIAVCLTEVAWQDEDVFRYYDFINAKDEAAFLEFKENIEQLNIFGDELDITLEDELLTLTTCNNYKEDGRLFLVAKRVDNTEMEE